jgi:hypothetical protein
LLTCLASAPHPAHAHPLCIWHHIPNLQVQFYVHGMGLNPAERRFRLTAALAMEAAALLLLAAEYCK